MYYINFESIYIIIPTPTQIQYPSDQLLFLNKLRMWVQKGFDVFIKIVYEFWILDLSVNPVFNNISQ